jgi:hypothetical protein
VFAYAGWGEDSGWSTSSFKKNFVESVPKGVTANWFAQDDYQASIAAIEAAAAPVKKTDADCKMWTHPSHVVLLGYSAGGDAVTRVAQALGDIGVDLAFTIDPVPVFRGPSNVVIALANPLLFPFPPVPGNVSRWVNFFQHTDTKTLWWLGQWPWPFSHGIWGWPIPGAAVDTQLMEKDFAGPRMASMGHTQIVNLEVVTGSWTEEINKVVAADAAEPWQPA